VGYTSKESGAYELYVQPYPGPGERVRVSTAGAFDFLWAPGGRELLYRAYTSTGLATFSVPIRSVAPFQVDPPRLLFETKYGGLGYDTTSPDRAWDISADGQRFLMLRVQESGDKGVTSMAVVLNWIDELKRLVPVK
jgi:hypothetical protein